MSKDSKLCSKKLPLQSAFNTEYRNQYKAHNGLNDVNTFELAMPHQNYRLSKEVYERANKLMPNHIKLNSLYRKDYEWPTNVRKIQKQQTNENIINKTAQFDTTNIDPAHSGYQKYLDSYASTNKMDYCFNDIFDYERSVNKHDIITVWDWFKVPRTKGRMIQVNIPNCQDDLKKVTKLSNMMCSAADGNRPMHHPSKFVPNRSLLTEQHEQFTHKSLSIKNPTNL